METIFGHHEIWTWIGVFIWGALILLTYKLFHAPKKNDGFKWAYFWNDNILDFLLNLLLSFIILRLGDKAIHELFDWIAKKFEFSFLTGEGMDVVILVSLISTPLSIYLHHKWRKPISKTVSKQMHVHNANCKHE